jgi:hypothetical protein
MEKPLRFDRMSGLDEKQLDELEELVADLLEEPWDKVTGRPREIVFREAPGRRRVPELSRFV